MRADLNSVISDDSPCIELINGSATFGSLVSVFQTHLLYHISSEVWTVFVDEKE